jgi:metallo-beta-lactamase class B
MGEADWTFLAGQGGANLRGSVPPRRDVALADGQTIALGGNTFRFHATPGHTPGTTSVEFTVYDSGKPYTAFFMGGVAPAAGVQPGEQAVASIERVERIQDRIQVRLVTHPWMDPMFWDRLDQVAQRKPGQPHPLVSNAIFRAYVQELKATMTKNLESARAKAGPVAR